jgi:hypothetical protein
MSATSPPGRDLIDIASDFSQLELAMRDIRRGLGTAYEQSRFEPDEAARFRAALDTAAQIGAEAWADLRKLLDEIDLRLLAGNGALTP